MRLIGRAPAKGRLITIGGSIRVTLDVSDNDLVDRIALLAGIELSEGGGRDFRQSIVEEEKGERSGAERIRCVCLERSEEEKQSDGGGRRLYISWSRSENKPSL